MASRTVMIESAINGNAMRELNPHIPYSPEEIANDAIATTRILIEREIGIA